MSEGNGLLKGKKGIIFGALDDRSIAWRVALACDREGAKMVLSNAPIALRLGALNALSEEIDAPIIPCDVSDDDAVKNSEVLISFCMPLGCLQISERKRNTRT